MQSTCSALVAITLIVKLRHEKRKEKRTKSEEESANAREEERRKKTGREIERKKGRLEA